MEKQMKIILIPLIALALVVTAAASEKKADKAEKATKEGFETTLSAGLTLTDGNSETLAANGSLITEGEKKDLGSVLTGIEANYGENTVDDVTDKTVNNAKAYGNVKKTLTEMTFGSLDASLLYDDIALVDYRTTVGPGLGAYLVKNDKRELSVEAGPAYLWEKVDGVSDDYFTLWFGERYTCQATQTAKLWEAVKYTPEAADFANYLLTAEVGVEAAMSERLSLRVVLQDNYDSTPAAETKRNDLNLIAGIGVKL
jgi:putative salt-induced outer membrane protein YdiY